MKRSDSWQVERMRMRSATTLIGGSVLVATLAAGSLFAAEQTAGATRRIANPLRSQDMSSLEPHNPALVQARLDTSSSASASGLVLQTASNVAATPPAATPPAAAPRAGSSLNELPAPPSLGGAGGFLESAGFGDDLPPLAAPTAAVPSSGASSFKTAPPAPPANPTPASFPEMAMSTPVLSAASPMPLVGDLAAPSLPAAESALLPTVIETRPSLNRAQFPLASDATLGLTPQLTIQKKYPEEVTLGAVTSLQILLHNRGTTGVRDIILRDVLPQGFRLIATQPTVSVGGSGGELFWSLGTLEAGAQSVIEIQVVPTVEGEMQSVASVSFTSDASARTVVTRPQLQVEVKSPEGTLLGDTVSLEFVVSNPGTGTARNVVLENHIPAGLVFTDERGTPIEILRNELGDIRPRQSISLTLPPLKCLGAGEIVNRLVVRGDDGLVAEARTPIHIFAPQLELAIDGAKSRFLERQATYTLSVSNPGTASAQNVDLVCQLPQGFQFVSTDQSGVYEPTRHVVHWALEELPAGEGGEIRLTLLPVRAGEQTLVFRGTGENSLSGEAFLKTAIDGMAATSFHVNCVSDMVEVGREAVYEIRVTNRGTKPSSGVGVAVQLSKGMELVKAEGPVQYAANYGALQFESLRQLDPKQEQVYRVAARCLADGDHRISVRLTADDLQAPLVKEENTRVISGQ